MVFEGRATNVSVDESERQRPRSAEELRDDPGHSPGRRQQISLRLQLLEGKNIILRKHTKTRISRKT